MKRPPTPLAPQRPSGLLLGAAPCNYGEPLADMSDGESRADSVRPDMIDDIAWSTPLVIDRATRLAWPAWPAQDAPGPQMLRSPGGEGPRLRVLRQSGGGARPAAFGAGYPPPVRVSSALLSTDAFSDPMSAAPRGGLHDWSSHGATPVLGDEGVRGPFDGFRTEDGDETRPYLVSTCG